MKHSNNSEKQSKFLLFAVGGIAVFIYEILVTILLFELFHIRIIYSYGFALLSGLGILFLYHSKVTFKLKEHPWQNLGKFVSLYVAVYIVAWAAVLISIHFGHHYLPSIVLVSLVCSLLNYKVNQKFIFNGKKVS